VVGELHRVLSAAGLAYEVIVVDDGSGDGSAAGLADARTIVLRNDAGTGSGAARRQGCRIARGRYWAWIDADGTYAATDLLRLWRRRGSADQIVGHRRGDHGRLRWLRLWVKRGICLVASWAWRSAIHDLNSGLRLVSRASATTWLCELPDGFSCTSTATLAALNRLQRVRFVPIAYRRRQVAPSKFQPWRDGWRLMAVVVRQWCAGRCRTRPGRRGATAPPEVTVRRPS